MKPLSETKAIFMLDEIRSAGAIHRGERMDTIREVAEQWREPGRPGPAQLLEVLDAVAGGRRRTA